MKRVIGLTGGIATGKSTVSRYLENPCRLPVFDADLYAREAVAPGSPALDRIVRRYGSNLLQSDGSLDRKQLGNIIFADMAERRWLEAQIHPYVRQRFSDVLAASPPSPCCFVVPLLFEARMTDLVTEIWVVSCTPEQQIRRLMARDRLSRERAIARAASQMPLLEKCDRASLVLDNTETTENLYRQIDRALRNDLEPS